LHNPSTFTAHNIVLDDGTQTCSAMGGAMDQLPNTVALLRILRLVFAGDLRGKTVVDLGCLEGGYSTEFARAGLISTGIEVRPSNYVNCVYVKSKVDLPNLRFINDNAWNVAKYGPFDAVFCAGLLYHIETPRRFISEISRACGSVLYIDSGYAPDRDDSPAIAKHSLSAFRA
jgi:2-polyprenyl-3-methyl-5-hydroxy-6-metoxy-1,4-benzoquinol methylase